MAVAEVAGRVSGGERGVATAVVLELLALFEGLPVVFFFSM